MLSNASYLFGAPAGTGIPSALIVQPLHAWILLFSVLAVACTVLWFLTGPLNADRSTRRPEPPMRRRRPRQWRMPHLPRLTRRRPLQAGSRA